MTSYRCWIGAVYVVCRLLWLVVLADREPLIDDQRIQYVQLAQHGQFEEAITIATSSLLVHTDDPLHLVELGLLHAYAGNYSDALRFCRQASLLAPDSSLAWSCISLAGLYLPETDGVVEASVRSIERFATEQEILLANGGEQSAAVLSSPLCALKMEDLQFNLLSLLRQRGMHMECINWFADTYALPQFMSGAVLVLTMAPVVWSSSARGDIDRLEQTARSLGLFQYPASTSLWEEIKRTQASGHNQLSLAQECLQGLGGDTRYSTLMDALLFEFMRIVKSRMAECESAQIATQGAISPSEDTVVSANPVARSVVLVLQYYAPTDPARSQDINVALWRNLQNDFITDIYLLNEVQASFRGMPNSHKIHQIVIGERLTFQRAFAFANQHLAGRTVIIANADIFFDTTLARLSGSDDRPAPRLRETRTVLALLKWKHSTATDTSTIDIRTDSQDAWVFQPPLDAAALGELNFYMGLPKCDNRLVYVLQQHNYTLLDPAFAVHAIEMESGKRDDLPYSTQNAVPGQGSNLLLTDQCSF